MVDAFALADDTMKEIDNLATIISQKFNEINQAGLDLDGKKVNKCLLYQASRQLRILLIGQVWELQFS